MNRALELSTQKWQRANLLDLLGEALFRQGRYEDAISIWNEGIQIYQDLGDQNGIAKLYARSSRAAFHQGLYPLGLHLSQEGWEAVGDMQENPSKAVLLHELGRAYHFNGCPEDAEPLCREALRMAERVGAVDTQADTLTTLGVLANVTSDESLASLEKAVHLAESNGLLDIGSRAHQNLGFRMLGDYGDHESSYNHFLHAADMARQRGAIQHEIVSLTSAADVMLAMGDMNKSQEIFTRVKKIESGLKNPNIVELDIASIEIGLNILGGNLEQPLETSRRGRNLARARGDFQLTMFFCSNIVDIYLLQDKIEPVKDWSEAEDAAKEGVDLSSRWLGFSQLHSQLATVYIRQGKLDKARQIMIEGQQFVGDAPLFWQKRYLLNIERDLARAEKDWQFSSGFICGCCREYQTIWYALALGTLLDRMG